MLSLLLFVIVVLVPIISSVCDEKDGVFCQEGVNKDIRNEWDYGFNIWSSSESRSNCNLRFSRIYSDYTCIDTEWIDPTKNLLIVSQGGHKDGGNPDHYMGSSWKDWVSGECVGKANNGNVEDCPPTEQDVQYWTDSWNVIFVDWRYYAYDADLIPFTAEQKLYTPVHEDYSVTDLLYEKLIALLDLTSWNGDELRLAGNSLGAQVVLILAAKLITDTTHNYGVKVQRIALLDAYYSTGQKWFLPEKEPCEWYRNWWWENWRCRNKWIGEYVREDLMSQIRSNIATAPVIENYRTSWLAGQDVPSFAIGDLGPGDHNWEFNKMTVFVDLKVYYYRSGDVFDLDPVGWKHAAALPIYTHCMKWESMGDLFDGAPSCRMDTDDLKLQCQITNWWDHCQYWYEQKDDAAAYTTWDYDDRFDRMDWDMTNIIDRPSGSSDKYKFNVVDYSVMGAVVAIFVSILWLLLYFICFGRKREQKYSPVVQDSDLSSDNNLTDSDM
eukprot:102226_1